MTQRYLGMQPIMIRQSSKSSSEYDDIKKIHTNEFKVKKKGDKLLETDNPEPIIKKIKSLSYIEKILESMNNAWLLLNDEKKRRKDNVIIELIKRRLTIIRQLIEKEEQEEIAKNKETFKELKTKLKRLGTKLEKIRANNPLYKAKNMEDNSEITREILTTNPSDVSDLQFAIRDIKNHIIEQEGIIKELNEQVCSRILTPKQVGPICWFMATFVAMFYSQRNRKVLLKVSKHWDTTDKLFTLLKHVLDDKYLSENGKEKDYEKFSDDTFGNILTLLFEKDSKSFPYNPELKRGFLSEVYICKLYNLLGVDCEMFDYIGGELLTYSYLNKEYHIMDYNYKFDDEVIKMVIKKVKKEYEKSEKDLIIELKDTYYTKNKSTPSTPTILILRVVNNLDYIISGNLIFDEMMNELTSMREEIKYNGKTYILDSVILSNYNLSKGRHTIAGITCKGIKYIYNGWERDPVGSSEENTQYFPCELQRHDWKVEGQGNDFCLNTRTCRPDILKEELTDEYRHCFNFSEGNRMLIYVLKDKHLEKLNKAATTLHATIRRSVAQKAHLEKLRKTEALHATIRRSVAQKAHLEKLRKAANAATTLQATIRRRRSVA
jgi:hypothetical protein